MKFFSELGAMVLFLGKVVRSVRHGFPARAFIDQLFTVGVTSLSTTLMTGLFVGAIMAIQVNMELKDFGAQSFLGGLTTSVTIRNVGPVLIAFILSGKVGAYTSAELGSMQVGDQVAALRLLGIDPYSTLLLPRMCAVMVSSFYLLVIGHVATVVGGIAISVGRLDVNPVQFIQNISAVVNGTSVFLGCFKSLWYGFLIGLIACYYGYHTDGGALGVGRSVRKSAVVSMVSIILFDYFFSSLEGAMP